MVYMLNMSNMVDTGILNSTTTSTSICIPMSTYVYLSLTILTMFKL